MKIGIVGHLGYWGSKLFRVFNSLDCEVFGFDIQEFDGFSLKQFIKTVDAVVIATPPKIHYDLALKFLNEGKHVLVEKPLALKYTDAWDLRNKAKQKELILMTDHTYLYTPEIGELKKWVCENRVKTIFSQRINLGIFQESNVIEDLAPHDLSILIYLFGKPIEVKASANKLVSKVDDEALITLDYGYFMARIHLSWFSPVKIRKMIFAGNDNMLVYDDCHENLKIQIYDHDVIREEDAIRHRAGKMLAPRLAGEEPLLVMAKDFIDCIKHNHVPVSHSELSCDVVSVINDAMVSIEEDEIWI